MSDRERLLEVLSDHKPHSHRELYDLGMIAHTRVSELRGQGHNIVCWRERTGTNVKRQPVYTYWYRLVPPLEGAAADGTIPGPGRPDAAAPSSGARAAAIVAAQHAGGVPSLVGDEPAAPPDADVSSTRFGACVDPDRHRGQASTEAQAGRGRPETSGDSGLASVVRNRGAGSDKTGPAEADGSAQPSVGGASTIPEQPALFDLPKVPAWS